MFTVFGLLLPLLLLLLLLLRQVTSVTYMAWHGHVMDVMTQVSTNVCCALLGVLRGFVCSGCAAEEAQRVVRGWHVQQPAAAPSL